MSLLINVSKSMLTDIGSDEFRLYTAFRYTEEVVRHTQEVKYEGVTLKTSHSIVSRLSLSEVSDHLKGVTAAHAKKAELGLIAKDVVRLTEVKGDGPSDQVYLLGYIIGVHRQYLVDQDAIERDWPLDGTPIVVKRNRYCWGERVSEAIPVEMIEKAIRRQKARQFKGVTFEIGVPKEKEKKAKAQPVPKMRKEEEKRQRAYRDYQLHQGAYKYTDERAPFEVLEYYHIYFDESFNPEEWQKALDRELERMKKEWQMGVV